MSGKEIQQDLKVNVIYKKHNDCKCFKSLNVMHLNRFYLNKKDKIDI